MAPKFFHVSNLVQRNRNSILTLQNSDGTWISGRANIEECFTSHFTDLFYTSNPVLPFDLANLITPVITLDDSVVLDSTPTREEMFNAVKSLGSTKASRPDGLPTLFYIAY